RSRIRDDFGGRKNMLLGLRQAAGIFPTRGANTSPPLATIAGGLHLAAPLSASITCQQSSATAHHKAAEGQALRPCAVGPQRTKVSRTLGNHHTTSAFSAN